jgi:hypothetical protein
MYAATEWLFGAYRSDTFIQHNESAFGTSISDLWENWLSSVGFWRLVGSTALIIHNTFDKARKGNQHNRILLHFPNTRYNGKTAMTLSPKPHSWKGTTIAPGQVRVVIMVEETLDFGSQSIHMDEWTYWCGRETLDMRASWVPELLLASQEKDPVQWRAFVSFRCMVINHPL